MQSLPALLVLALVVPLGMEAQAPDLVVGARVRVTAPNFGLDKHVTTVTELRGDSVVVGVKGRPRTIALRDFSALEVSAGKRMRVLPFALMGLGIGAVGGYVIGATSYEEGAWCCANSAEGEGMIAGSVFGVLGFFTGAITGALYRGDRWVSATPPARATVAITRTGASIGFTRAF